MNCPFCNGQQLFVINSRPTKKNSQVWRRKRCGLCGEIFTTYEKIDLSYIIVVKKSGKKERYERAKLYSGVYNATVDVKGANKGESSVLADKFTNKIEDKIMRLRKKEVSTEEIINIALEILNKESPFLSVRYLIFKEGDENRKLKRLAEEYLAITTSSA